MSAYPAKPHYHTPCNGCGLCCVAQPCEFAVALVPGARNGVPCPALEWRDGRAWCGMMMRPAHHSPLVAMLLLTRHYPSEGYVARQIKDSMVSPDGCDAGPPGLHGVDYLEGLTAAQWQEDRDASAENPAIRL